MLNNKELIELFLSTHKEYVYGIDYIITNTREYIVITPFNINLMVHFNGWLRAYATVNNIDPLFKLKHCTTKRNAFLSDYAKTFQEKLNDPIKCYAFKKNKCIFETFKYEYETVSNIQEHEKVAFDECAYWIDIKHPNLFCFLHSVWNGVYTDQSPRKVICGDTSLMALDIFWLKRFKKRMKLGKPILPIDNNKIINNFIKVGKPKINILEVIDDTTNKHASDFFPAEFDNLSKGCRCC